MDPHLLEEISCKINQITFICGLVCINQYDNTLQIFYLKQNILFLYRLVRKKIVMFLNINIVLCEKCFVFLGGEISQNREELKNQRAVSILKRVENKLCGTL